MWKEREGEETEVKKKRDRNRKGKKKEAENERVGKVLHFLKHIHLLLHEFSMYCPTVVVGTNSFIHYLFPFFFFSNIALYFVGYF